MARTKVTEKLIFENAKIIYRNFEGRASKFNDKGKRNFCIVLDPDMAEKLGAEGWNVKMREAHGDYADPLYYIQVSVKFEFNPPKIFTVAGKTLTQLNEETVGLLDHADIESVDITVSPYNWEAKGETGVKGYVKTMYVNLEEDKFADKYRGLNEPPNGDTDCPFN